MALPSRALQPHLLLPGTRGLLPEFFDRLGSNASVQPFGWMEGCVLDGLLDLGETPHGKRFTATAKDQLALFLPHGKLVYENSRGVPSDGRNSGIEGTLPFAALARVEPGNPWLDSAAAFWDSRADADGVVADGKTLTSEGSYTVGYPMAVIGRTRKSDRLERAALTQIRVRHRKLFDGQRFTRVRQPDGKTGDVNWSRGIAWQLLGATRTLAALRHRDDIKDAVAECQQLAEWVMKSQRADGLWSVTTSEAKLSADTAGSAGIAAGLAIGSAVGFLGDAAGKSADRTLAALQTHLTADGFLAGVAQANKGGPRLQSGKYRVIYQMGMGLMAQLVAARS